MKKGLVEVIDFNNEESLKKLDEMILDDDQDALIERSGITSIDWWGSTSNKKRKLKTKDRYDDNLDLYQTLGIIFAIVNLRAHFSVGVGFEIQCPNIDIRNYIRRKFRNLGLIYWDDNVSEMLYNISKRKDLFGNEYWEKVADNDENISKLIPIKAKLIHPEIDEKGNVTGYTYTKPNKYTDPNKTETFKKEEIIHFKSDTVEDSAIGMSKVYPCVNEAKAVREVSKIAITLIKVYVKPWLHFRYEEVKGGSSKKVARQLKRLVNYLQDHKQQTDFVTSAKWTLTPIKSPFQMSEIKEFIKLMDEKILMSFEVPDSFFMSYGSTDLKVAHQMENFKRVMRSTQSHIGHVLMDQLIIPMVKAKFGKDIEEMEEKDIPRIVWNNIIEKDIIDYARAATSLFEKGVLNQDEARELIGYEPSDMDLEDELKDLGDEETDEEESPEEPDNV